VAFAVLGVGMLVVAGPGVLLPKDSSTTKAQRHED